MLGAEKFDAVIGQVQVDVILHQKVHADHASSTSVFECVDCLDLQIFCVRIADGDVLHLDQEDRGIATDALQLPARPQWCQTLLFHCAAQQQRVVKTGIEAEFHCLPVEFSVDRGERGSIGMRHIEAGLLDIAASTIGMRR